MAVDHNNPQSRDEEILIATIDGTEYNKNPQSRMEELLLELKEAIEEGGGGGGTTDYENLSNQPQVNGETLIGDKSGADLGLVDAEEGKGLSTNDYDDTEKAAVADATSAISAMKDGTDIDSFGDVEVALLDKQDELTAGKYIQFTNDEISVKRDIAYEADEVLFAEQTNEGLHVTVTVGSTTLYEETLVTSDSEHTVLDLVQTRFSFRAVRWILTYLKASKTRSAGDEAVVWPSVTDTFVTTVDADKKLIIQSELDDAINSAVSKCYHHAGTKTCAELLPALLIAANEGNVYEITDSGTTTSDFMEGIGHPIKEGDNIGVARVSEGVYKFDLLSGFVDTSNFVQKSSTAGLIMNDGTIDTVAKQPATDNNLTTTDKTTTGAVNELMSGLTNLDNEVNGDATTYPYADVITIEDAVPSNLADCSVKIEPVQDLHGYDKPWVGGAGKNKAYVNINSGETALTEIKDNDNNVIGVNADVGAAGIVVTVKMATVSIKNGKTYTLSGSPNDKGNSTYRLDVRTQVQGQLYNNWNEIDNPTITATEDVTLDIYLRIAANYAVNNLVFHPQIEEGTTATTFAPYENICLITGHTEASVQRANGSIISLEQGTIDVTNGNNLNSTTRVRTGFLSVEPNGVYSLYSENDNLVYRNGIAYDANNGFIMSGIAAQSGVVTIPDNNSIAYIRFVFSNTTETDVHPTDYWCEFANGIGKTYTIALGDTIYGGTVDFNSGVMTVDRAVVDMGNLAWQISDNVLHVPNSALDDLKVPNNNVPFTGLCEVAKSISANNRATETACCIYSYVGFVYVRNTGYDNASKFKSDMAGKKICYELATPTTIQLTPQQIQLLKGTNTLTASTGQISVTVNGVSGSIGSLTSDKQDKTDYALETTEKTVVGAINEIKDSLAMVTPTPAADVTITKGGYVELGNLVLVDFYFTVSGTHAANTRIAILPSTAVNNASLPIYNITDETTLSGGRMYETGIFAGDALVVDKTYNARGLYVKA